MDCSDFLTALAWSLLCVRGTRQRRAAAPWRGAAAFEARRARAAARMVVRYLAMAYVASPWRSAALVIMFLLIV